MKKLTLLHSNDLHGDFLADEPDAGQDGDILRAAMQGYHYQGMQKHLGIPVEEVEKNAPPAELATEAANVLEEYFLNHDYVKLDGKQRLHIHR